MSITPDWITASALVALLGAVGKVLYDVNTKLGKVYEHIEGKVGRLYQRLDEDRERSDKKYVTKEVCDIMHTQTKDSLEEIKTDLKEILKRADNGNL